MKFSLTLLAAALVASANAFVPAPAFGVQRSSQLNAEKDPKRYGKYDDMLWDMTAKLEIYGEWDPAKPRSPWNFNPFETWDGNSPDASGWFPGQNTFKDPTRGDINFASMQEERKILDDIIANPKEGNVPGAPGCKN
ncbi:hypothetical protein TrLO_g7058 [Triparma laevis f. longispina]|uniref:Uncharacterized protein n=1 Tax=Triparma laevis f. longispina TaxID=1714387 RepID=A0A9W7ALR3_9STRA|nr:hypothetical protein TrLO_g7058 [Triparma laevis f. longispina]